MGLRNVSMDYCKYVSGTGGSLVLDVFLGNGENNMKPCPFEVYMSRLILKSQERMLYIYSLPQGYFFIRTDLTNLQIPRMVPAGSYMIDIIETAIIVGQRKDMILRVQIEGHIGQRKFQAG